MKYLYKLLDETTFEILLDKNAISLSRPLMSGFKYEAVGFKIFKEFSKLDRKNTSVKDLCADSKLRKQVNEWFQGYMDSIPTELKDEFKSKTTILNYIEIIMSEYFRTYCGYLSFESLDKDEIWQQYKKKNRNFVIKRTHCVKIPIETNHFDSYATSWKHCGDDTYLFHKVIDSKSSSDYNDAVLHIHGVEYKNPTFLEKPFILFNSDNNRKISSLLKYVDVRFNEQAEKRLMLWIPNRILDNQEIVQFTTDSFEEMLIYKIRKICLESLEYPKYVYLKIEGHEIIR